MKRRIQGLVSSTGGAKTAKRRAWQEDEEEDDKKKRPVRRLANSDDEGAPKPPPEPGSDDEAWNALEQAAGGEDPPPPPPPDGPNPVAWMDITVAGKPRGRAYFELFRDVVPRTAENFRRLCLGVPEDPRRPEGPRLGYKGSELYKVVYGKCVEGGEFDRAADGKEFDDENFQLEHSKAGLLSMANDGPHTNTSRFQVTFRPLPLLNKKQVVFGQVLAHTTDASSGKVHPLHWAGAMGTVSGTPLETVVVDDCGECDPAEAARLLGSASASESQSDRYSRAGSPLGQLEDAISTDTVFDMLELTESVLSLLEWQAKTAERVADGRDRVKRVGEVEAGLKSLKAVLEDVEFKAGDVQASDGKQGRKAKAQIFRVRDLEESLGKVY